MWKHVKEFYSRTKRFLGVVRDVCFAIWHIFPIGAILALPGALVLFMVVGLIYQQMARTMSPLMIICAVTIASVLITARATKKYSEAMLQFFVSMLAVFTVSWTDETARLFVGFCTCFTSLLLLSRRFDFADIVSEALIRSGSSKELIRKYARLKKCGLPRHETALSLAFLLKRGVPIDALDDSFNLMVKIHKCGIPTAEATDLALRLVGATTVLAMATRDRAAKERLVMTVVGSSLGPEGALTLFEKTIRLVLSDRMSVGEYLELFEACCRTAGVSVALLTDALLDARSSGAGVL